MFPFGVVAIIGPMARGTAIEANAVGSIALTFSRGVRSFAVALALALATRIRVARCPPLGLIIVQVAWPNCGLKAIQGRFGQRGASHS